MRQNRFTHCALGPTPLPDISPPAPPLPSLSDFVVLPDASFNEQIELEADSLRAWISVIGEKSFSANLTRQRFGAHSRAADCYWNLEPPRRVLPERELAWRLRATDCLLREFTGGLAALRITADLLGLVISGSMRDIGIKTDEWPAVQALSIVCDSAESLFQWPAVHRTPFRVKGVVRLTVELPTTPGRLIQSSDFMSRLMRWTRDFIVRCVSDHVLDTLQFRNVEKWVAKDLNRLAWDPARGKCDIEDIWPREEASKDPNPVGEQDTAKKRDRVEGTETVYKPRRVHVTFKNWG